MTAADVHDMAERLEDAWRLAVVGYDNSTLAERDAARAHLRQARTFELNVELIDDLLGIAAAIDYASFGFANRVEQLEQLKRGWQTAIDRGHALPTRGEFPADLLERIALAAKS